MIWVTTKKGKQMPLDAEPVARGAFIFDGDPEEARVVYIGEKDPYRGERYSSHFATCPNAKDFSKEKSR